jgi:hypothetical protein
MVNILDAIDARPRTRITPNVRFSRKEGTKIDRVKRPFYLQCANLNNRLRNLDTLSNNSDEFANIPPHDVSSFHSSAGCSWFDLQ